MTSETEPEGRGAESADRSSGVAVLDRAFALLAAFGATDDRLSLTELSRRTGLYKSTVLRLLAALEHGGFIRRLQDGHYAVGPQPMRLAAIYQRSFRVDAIVEPLLGELSVALGETASFYVRVGDRRLVLARVEPARAVRVSVRVGEDFPVERGASGKVLSAFTGGNTPADDLVRSRLWATSYGERDPETASAAVAVFGALGDFKGAMTVSGPLSRLGQAEAMFAAVSTLLEMGRRASALFGASDTRFAVSRESLTPSAVKPDLTATPPDGTLQITTPPGGGAAH